MSIFGDKIFVRGAHTCPWWFCFTFDNPVRAIFQNPEKILSGLVKKGDHILDIGPGQGYFTFPMAKMTGNTGSVTALDIQKKMLDIISHKAKKSGIENVLIKWYDGNAFGLSGKYDFINIFWMFHEIKNKDEAVLKIRQVCKKTTRILFAEPKVHVTLKSFNASLDLFLKHGFKVDRRFEKNSKIGFSRAVLLRM